MADGRSRALASAPGFGPKRLALFGSTGRTGRKIAELALDRGNHVAVLVRHPASLRELAGRVNVVEGDVVDPAAVDKAVLGSDAVLSALGHVKGSPRDLETAAVRNIVASMDRGGVRRLVVLSSSVVADPADKPRTTQALTRWMVKTFRREVYDDSVAKARVIQSSDLDWTIVRASILTNAQPAGKYRVGRMDKGASVRISRGDVADFMLKCATEGKYVRECPYISD
jgi:putative NADH-flavin reductase